MQKLPLMRQSQHLLHAPPLSYMQIGLRVMITLLPVSICIDPVRLADWCKQRITKVDFGIAHTMVFKFKKFCMLRKL